MKNRGVVSLSNNGIFISSTLHAIVLFVAMKLEIVSQLLDKLFSVQPTNKSRCWKTLKRSCTASRQCWINPTRPELRMWTLAAAVGDFNAVAANIFTSEGSDIAATVSTVGLRYNVGYTAVHYDRVYVIAKLVRYNGVLLFNELWLANLFLKNSSFSGPYFCKFAKALFLKSAVTVWS